MLPVTLEILTLPGCPNAEAMTDNLTEACRVRGMSCRIEPVSLETLAETDPRRGWGSPTVLLNGVDLMGATKPPGTNLSCRRYPGGAVPPVDAMVERLKVCATR